MLEWLLIFYSSSYMYTTYLFISQWTRLYGQPLKGAGSVRGPEGNRLSPWSRPRLWNQAALSSQHRRLDQPARLGGLSISKLLWGVVQGPLASEGLA